MEKNAIDNINWASIVLESFFVVLGVVLALTANEFREAHNNAKRAEKALVSMLDELEANQTRIHASIDYHAYVMDTLRAFTRAYGETTGRYPSARLFHKGFLYPARLVSHAWEASSSTGVVEFMDYDTVLLLSQLYENQRGYELQSTAVAERIYERIFDQGVHGVAKNYVHLQSIIVTFIQRECELARRYQDTFSVLIDDVRVVEVPDLCAFFPER